MAYRGKVVAIVGSGKEAVSLVSETTAIAWEATDVQVPLGLRFEGMTIVGLNAVEIDGSLSGSFFSDVDARSFGLVFEDCAIVGGVLLMAVGLAHFINTPIDPDLGDLEVRECGTVVFVSSDLGAAKTNNPNLFQYSDGGLGGYVSNVRFYSTRFFDPGIESRARFLGSVVAVADEGTEFDGEVLIGEAGDPGVGPVHFTAAGRLLGGMTIAQSPLGASSVAVVVDLSGAYLEGDYDALVLGGVGRATFRAKNAVFAAAATIDLLGSIDGDLLGATFTPANLTGNGASTCRRVVQYTNADLTLANNVIAIPVPQLPDANYTVEVTPNEVIASSPWAVTGKTAAQFEVNLTAPNPGLVGDIVVTPFIGPPP